MITLKINIGRTQDYYSLTLIAWCMKLKRKMCIKIWYDKERYDFINYSGDSKCYNLSTKLVVDKIKDEGSGVLIKEFFGLKSKLHSF